MANVNLTQTADFGDQPCSVTRKDSARIILMEACNFVNAPLGGQLSTARMLMRAFGPRLALVGWTDDPQTPLGCWHKRVINNQEFDFFATDFVANPHHRKGLIPARATNWYQFKIYGKAILAIGIVNILTKEPTIMMALPFTADHNVCYWFPGIAPPLSISRYPWAKFLSPLFDKLQYRSIRRHARTILAAADDQAIRELQTRAGKNLAGCTIKFFPTRIDTNLFHPGNRQATRQALQIPATSCLVVTSGRLHRAKGWPLLLKAFAIFLADHPDATLIFVGDGHARGEIEQAIDAGRLTERIILAGQQSPEKLALFLQAADLFVMASEIEGWSSSLVEALATGLPIVVTRFSSADSIVCHGRNGFVVERDPVLFAQAMTEALLLPAVGDHSRLEAQKYALTDLVRSLEAVWPLVDDPPSAGS